MSGLLYTITVKRIVTVFVTVTVMSLLLVEVTGLITDTLTAAIVVTVTVRNTVLLLLISRPLSAAVLSAVTVVSAVTGIDSIVLHVLALLSCCHYAFPQQTRWPCIAS